MNLYNKKKSGEIVIAFLGKFQNFKENYVYIASFLPSGEPEFRLQTKKQSSGHLSKHPVGWKNGGNKLFLQIIFFPLSIGESQKDRNKAIKYILSSELEKENA